MSDASAPCLPEAASANLADLAACRALLREGSRTFHMASMVLPRAIRDPACALYAFCRVADDEIDRGDAPAALADLRARLDLAYAGRPRDNPVDRAFAHVVRHFALPRELPDSLLEGFAWDAQGRRYETMDDLHAYAARVAGSVGVMMAVLMGARDPARLARACDLGMAMQLSNIARDVGEDARAGRLYLPLSWLREAGIDPARWVAAPAFTPALGSVLARLLAEAEALYGRAESGVRALPLGARPGIAAARILYAEIGREVARAGFDSVSDRAVVSLSRKLAGLAWAVAGSVLPGMPDPAPALPQAAYLVEAVQPATPVAPAAPVRATPRVSRFDDRVAWIVDLFTRLDERDTAPARGR